MTHVYGSIELPTVKDNSRFVCRKCRSRKAEPIFCSECAKVIENARSGRKLPRGVSKG